MNKPIRLQVIPEQFGRYKGCDVIPLRGGEKRPLDNGWQKQHYNSEKVIAKAIKTGSNIGLRLGDGEGAIDYDPRNDPTGDSLERLAHDFGLDLSTFPNVETGGGGQHYFMKLLPGLKITTTLAAYPGVEFKTKGTQVVCAGSVHPTTGRHYLWSDFPNPPLSDAPPAPLQLVDAIARPLHDFAATGGGIHTHEQIADMLEGLDPGNFASNDKWFPLMCACHHASGGDARDEFLAWSLNDPEYAHLEDIIGRRWDSLHREKPGAITYRTLYDALHKAGKGKLIPPKADVAADFDDVTALGQSDTKQKTAAGLQVLNAATIEPESIDFIWENRLARGMHTAIAGVGGKGKSQLAYAIIAAITTGGPWPDKIGNAPKGRCIVLSAEEGKKDMIVPRLTAAGADLSMVEIVSAVVDDTGKERKFNLQQDLDALKALCLKFGDVVLISIDPVSSYMGGDLDTHRNSAVRTVLDPITKCAEDIGCAILSITHFNKNTSQKAVNRVMEFAAFTNAPRAAFCVLEDPDDPVAHRLFLLLKTNMGEEPPGLRFHVEAAFGGFDKKKGVKISAPRIVWDEIVSMTADEATEALNKKEQHAPRLDEAVMFLQRELKDGPKPVTDVKGLAEDVFIAQATLKRARNVLGVRALPLKGSIPPVWEYVLPPPPPEEG